MQAPPAPAPYLPPLSLSVKGTGIPADTPHSFFAKRAQPTKPAGAEQQSQSRGEAGPSAPTPRRPKALPSLPTLPTQSSQHVRPPNTDTDNVLEQLRSLPLPFGMLAGRSPKGKGKERANDIVCTNENDLHLPQSGLLRKFQLQPPGKSREALQSLQPADPASAANALNALSPSSPHAEHPAFQAILTKPRDYARDTPWSQRYRPSKARQVLSNEDVATYLSSWLHVLQITGKRNSGPPGEHSQIPVVPGSPPRKKFRRGAAAVPSSESDDALDDEDEELIAFFRQFHPRSARRRLSRVILDDDEEEGGDGDEATVTGEHSAPALPSVEFDPSRELSNGILLTGPSGCGKTAMVFACAEEMGYEVFELYPGMGRRSNKDVQAAVGDLGRNHMVSGGGSHASAFSAMMKGNAAGASAHQGTARQSLILIEEVDILFRDDIPFWSGVAQLINTSRRPVVMTCNDPSFVPLDDLRLQEVLDCRPVDKTTATEYLRWIAAAEGSGLRCEDDLARAIEAPDHGDGIDLRQALNQLQFDCMGSRLVKDADEPSGRHANEMQGQDAIIDSQMKNSSPELDALRQASMVLSHLSTLSSHLVRPHTRQAMIDDPPPRGEEGGPDDLCLPPTWRSLVSQPSDNGARVALPLYNKEDEVREEYIRLLRAYSGDKADLIDPISSTMWARQFEADLRSQLEHLVTLLYPQLRSVTQQNAALLTMQDAKADTTSTEHLALHYAAALRHIVSIEDFEEASSILELHQRKADFLRDLQQGVAAPPSARTTRNSSGLFSRRTDQFTRVFDLGKDALQAARKSGSAFMCARREFYQREDDGVKEQQEEISTPSISQHPASANASVIQDVLASLVAQSGGGTDGNRLEETAHAAPLFDTTSFMPHEARQEIESKLGWE